MVTAAELAHRLKGRRAGHDHWMCKCPCHEDRSPSLSITQKGNRVLLWCFAGCRTQDVLDHLSVSFSQINGDASVRLPSSFCSRPTDWEAEWEHIPRRLAQAVVGESPKPKTQEQQLRKQYRETAWAYRWIQRRIESHLHWISLLVEHERALDEIEAQLTTAQRKGSHA